ncbi:uncharacterized protein LOC121640751 [Melanotaenia boesemani]|uniref:uncharacterized protein LOC121640751 n=1 Tax=Melanotaenia boesemani TaxID=1250792 RepID=UPI001C05AB93|nr:uncharacterized protein LOC121640751 [Melanotaenia boesemani]
MALEKKMDQQPNIHFSIRKGLSFPPLEQCTTCCSKGLYHCPFCLPTFFKPTKRSRVMVHLDNHLRRACYFGEYTIHKCALECRKQPHFHCLYCNGTFIKKETFSSHFLACQEGHQQQKNLELFNLQTVVPQSVQISEVTPEESLIPSFHMESNDGSEGDDITIIPDSGEEDCQEGSSSHSVTHFISRSNTPGTVGRVTMSAGPDSSKRDQMVQTNIEKPQDCDEYYFMNLVKMFKKLCPKKKTEVRMKIERILFEAEFQ